MFQKMPDICIYHDNCMDGLVAAWAVYTVYGTEPEYEPRQYGQRPGVDLRVAAGAHILMVDFSLPRDEVRALAKVAATVTILDHHKTARDALAGLPVVEGDGSSYTRERHEAWMRNVRVTFDMDRSGAMLAWQHFYGTQADVPMLVQHVQDRDLWQFKLSQTKGVHLLLQSETHTSRTTEDKFGDIDDLATSIEVRANTYSQARALVLMNDMLVDQLADTAILMDIAGQSVPVVSTPYALVSDTCHRLLGRYPDAPFAAAVVHAYGKTTISMRSEDSRADVSEIAKRYGGGGHRNAAGFPAPWFLWPVQIDHMAQEVELAPQQAAE